MKNTIAILILVISCQIGLAQQLGQLKGKVQSEGENEPVAFATVTLTSAQGDQHATTDMEGRFHFSALNSGTYNLKITTAEYADLSLKDIQVNTGETTFLNELKMSSNLMGVVNIIWHKDLIKKDNPAMIPILAADIKKSAVRNSPIGIVSQLPGITSNGEDQLYFRGSRPQGINTFIDGVKVMDGGIGRIPSNAIKSVNVYTGGVPAAYGDVTGGVIIFETKSYMDFYNEFHN